MKLIDIIRAKRQDQRRQAELRQAAAQHRAYVKDETDRVEPGFTPGARCYATKPGLQVGNENKKPGLPHLTIKAEDGSINIEKALRQAVSPGCNLI